MQLTWLWRGLRTGVLTTRYPRRPERMPDGWRGTAVLQRDQCVVEGAPPSCVTVCLPRALSVEETGGDRRLRLDHAACIACGLCVAACPRGALSISNEFELAASSRARLISEHRPKGDRAA
ncbi:MAG: 4Fe-4S binding protein [Chloroflexi bacterium]|nr:4Fe-4S binding protein [Chloroflexota bacterium]